jgi:hypothetical protein
MKKKLASWLPGSCKIDEELTVMEHQRQRHIFFRLKGLRPRFHFRRKETTSSYNEYSKRKRVQQKVKTTQVSAAGNKSRD